MYCRNCGHLLNESDRFCPNCGAKNENREDAIAENSFIPPFRREAQKQDEAQQQNRPRRNFQFEEFNWNLDGYPTEDSHKTEDIDFNWESVMDERNRKRREEGPPTFFEKKEEPAEEQFFKGVTEEQLGHAASVAPVAAAPADKEPQKSVEEELFSEIKADDMSRTIRVDDYSDLGKTTKIDKFYTYNKKNEEFQALLDQEYNRLKSHIEDEDEEPLSVAEPEPEAAPEPVEVKTPEMTEAEPARTEEPVTEPVPSETIREDVPDVRVVRESGADRLEYVGVSMPETPANVIAYDIDIKDESVDEPVEAAAPEAAAVETVDKAETETIEAEKAEEPVTEPEKKGDGGAAEPADNRLTFGDVFADEEEDHEADKGPKKHTALKVIAVLLCIVIAFLVTIICVKYVAPDSAAGIKIQELYNNIFGSISSLFG